MTAALPSLEQREKVKPRSMLAILPRRAAVFLVSASVGGGILAVLCFVRLPGDVMLLRTQPQLFAIAAVLLGAAVAFGARPVRLGPSTKVHMGAAPLFCAALLLPAPAAGILAYVSALSHNLWLRRRPWNAVFNAAQHLASAGGASLVYRETLAGAPEPAWLGAALALPAAGLIYFVLSVSSAAAMAALAQGKPFGQTMWATWRLVWAHYLTLLTFGWFAALVALNAGWSFPLLVVPVIVAYRFDATLGDLLAARQRLSEALERQRQFAGDVAHELGAPLTSVAGNAAVLLADPALPEDLREPLEDMHAEAVRTATLLKDLLLLSKVEEGRQIEFQDVALHRVAERALRLSQTAADARGMELTLSAEGESWVRGVPELLEQLVLNLIDNAIKYGRPDGWARVDIHPRPQEMSLTVSDSGPGIAPEELARIFERGYGTGKANSRALGGAGLGLAIARRIAQAHGGRLTADSAPGQGSRFTLTLPQAKPPGEQPSG